MATKTPGSGGTDQTTTIEAGTVHLIRLIQSLEADSARNPSGLNNITSSTSDDSRTISASINLPCNLIASSDGTTYQIVAIDYFTQPPGQVAAYTAGSGGTFKGATVQQALIQHLIAQNNLEFSSQNNPTNGNYITYQISNASSAGNGNAVFSATVSGAPLDISNNANGQQISSGKTYLT